MNIDSEEVKRVIKERIEKITRQDWSGKTRTQLTQALQDSILHGIKKLEAQQSASKEVFVQSCDKSGGHAIGLHITQQGFR